VYKYTGDPQYLTIAKHLGRYFLDHLPADGVVYYDFDDPRAPEVPKDTSAQSIAAAGFLALSALSTGEDREWCLNGAQILLRPLCDAYLVRADADSPVSRGLLREGCYFWSKGRGVNSELMFGDYYMIEALTRFLCVAQWR
jgi:unsaturated chondroitin disaccharide hydrolase